MAKILLLLQGLPGSGKSTYAKLLQEENRNTPVVIVNKDSIRRELEAGGWIWSQKLEQDVIVERDARIATAFLNNERVIVVSDDTNFGRVHKVRLAELAREYGAELQFKSFNEVPIATCIERDSKREGKARVGPDVINKMAARYLKEVIAPEIKPYVIPENENSMSAIICDLDGTLSLFQGLRSAYDASTADKDKINEPIRNILEVYYRFMHWQIIYLSGREDKFRAQTEIFLRENHCPPGPLWMRKSGDFRKDFIVKYEIFNREVREKYHVRFVLDDRPQVLRMWQKMGLTTLAVGDLKEF